MRLQVATKKYDERHRHCVHLARIGRHNEKSRRKRDYTCAA